MPWVYQMRRVRVARGDKVILDDVTLAFLPGAKIGVVGPNGAGKSTVVKVVAGWERPSNGEATLAPGLTVGLLPQEPVLDESTTVLENVEAGVAETKALLARYEELTERLATDDWSNCWTRRGACRSSWTTAGPGIWTRSSSRRWTRCAARPPTPRWVPVRR